MGKSAACSSVVMWVFWVIECDWQDAVKGCAWFFRLLLGYFTAGWQFPFDFTWIFAETSSLVILFLRCFFRLSIWYSFFRYNIRCIRIKDLYQNITTTSCYKYSSAERIWRINEKLDASWRHWTQLTNEWVHPDLIKLVKNVYTT